MRPHGTFSYNPATIIAAFTRNGAPRPLTIGDVESICDLHYYTARNALRQLTKAGTIRTTDSAGRTQIWELA